MKLIFLLFALFVQKSKRAVVNGKKVCITFFFWHSVCCVYVEQMCNEQIKDSVYHRHQHC